MNVTIHIDGGSRGNPGPAAAGVTIRDTDTGKTLYEAGRYLGRATNNVAEYHGLLHALEAAAQLGARGLRIYTDSQLMARQIRGEYRVKSADLKPLFDQASRALNAFDNWRIQDVRREKNKRADELVNKALDAKKDIGDPHAHADPAHPAARTAPPSRSQSRPSPTVTEHWFEACFSAATGPKCPAPSKAGDVYPIGPTLPAGLCVYAAKAIAQADLLDDESIASAALDRPVKCSRCGVTIQLRPAGE